MSNMLRLLPGLLAATLLAGCGTLDKVMPKKVDYKQSRSEPPLEIPPDLSASGFQDSMVVPSATYSEYAASGAAPRPEQSRVLPVRPDMHIERDGDARWLVVEAPPEKVWPRVREFWLKNGFLLTVDDPQVGILETEWAENRADIPQDPIRRTIGKALNFLYSAATRDKFRVRMERTAQGTEIYLSHRGMEEVVEGTPDESTGTIWKPRASDPELEAEMLKRLMVFLGTEEQKAAAQLAQARAAGQPRATLVTDTGGQTLLKVHEDFSRAWRRTGIALDRIGFAVEDRDRSQGLYFVRYRDPLAEDRNKGILSKLAFWRDRTPDEGTAYRIRLVGEGGETRVTVEDVEGRRDNSRTARRILTLLEEQLK